MSEGGRNAPAIILLPLVLVLATIGVTKWFDDRSASGSQVHRHRIGRPRSTPKRRAGWARRPRLPGAPRAN